MLHVCLPSPGMALPGFSGDQPICDASRTLAPSSRGEVQVGIVARHSDKGLERGGAGLLQRRVRLALQFLVEALANNGPIAQVIGHRPNQFDSAGTEFGDLLRGSREEGFRSLASASRQDHQELTTAARPQEDPLPTPVRPAGRGAGLHKQSDPLRFASE